MPFFLKSFACPALLACAALTLTNLSHAEPTNSSTAIFDDPVVATGKNFQIKRSQVDDAYIDYSAAVVSSGRSIAPEDRPLVRAKVLDNMIINRILLQKATPDDKAAVTKLVESEIAEARSNAPSPTAFDEELKAKGMTLAQVRDQAVEKQLVQRILLREATNNITVTDLEVTNFYRDNQDQFKIPERVRVAHILISTLDPVTQQPLPPDQKRQKLKLANDLKARADKGEDFTALVKQYSDDIGSKNKGGEYTFGRGQMVPEFEGAAFSMKINQISDPVESHYGYHIIKLLEKLPASSQDFAQAAPRIREYLTEKGLPAYFDKLKAAADVKILDQTASISVKGGDATPPK